MYYNIYGKLLLEKGRSLKMSILPQYKNKNCKVLMQKKRSHNNSKTNSRHVKIIITVKYSP